MSLYEVLFIILSTVILVFSMMTILSRRILRSATYLLFVLIATSVYYAWLEYQFMAAVQLALYAGGIVVIIVFSILLTHHIHHKSKPFPPIRLITGFGVAILGAVTTILTIVNHEFGTQKPDALELDVKTIGQHMTSTGHDGFALPFEVISILLLAVLIGAIIVAKKDNKTETQA